MSNPMIPDDTPMVCLECQALVRMDFVAAHMRWHEVEKLNQQMLHLHVENLIERMHTAEKQVEGLLARAHLIERNIGMGGTWSHSQQTEG